MNTWTDEKIAAELGAIANENFDYLVVLRMAQTVVLLMRKMRKEMQAEIDDQLAVQQAFDSAFTAQIEKHAALLAWAQRAYAAMGYTVLRDTDVYAEAPEVVKGGEG